MSVSLRALRRLALSAAAALSLVASHHALAAEPPQPTQAADALASAALHGPADAKLDNQGVLHVPAGRVFIPQPQAAEMLRKMGNPGSHSDVRGLVFPEKGDSWFAVVSWEGAGYVKDDDAKDWNADDLLKSFREGTEASNAERKKMGVNEMEIVGWAEKPHYDATTHRLVWAMASKDIGAPAGAEQGVNFNTYALGREGYFSMNLITDLKELPAHKPQAEQLLAALDFADGKKYTDFNSSTDRVAEYGLAALVLGVGAKKLGLLAGLGLALAKFGKLIFLGGAAVVVGLGKLFAGRGKSGQA